MDSIWSRKGATLSDKSARQEFGLTQEEIFWLQPPDRVRLRSLGW